jgi:putative DNA methylase
MTRMIERWFPCAEVSANSTTGWGSGNGEIGLFPWFAKRPTAQAKAAVICSLLPWPDDVEEQERLQRLVTSAMTGRYAAWEELRNEIIQGNPEGASVLDPFSGRGMIPLEAARLGLPAFGIDYSPVAVLASRLLTEFPFRNWDDEPALPFASETEGLYDARPRLLADVESMLAEVGRRWKARLTAFYPAVGGKQPWAYLWAITLPCQECGARFPLVGSFELRRPTTKKARSAGGEAVVDRGQSFYIDADASAGTCSAVVHDGPPMRTPTLTSAVGTNGRKLAGKSAICPFCYHVHPLEVHRRLTDQGEGRDMLLVVADHADGAGKEYRQPTAGELEAASAATAELPNLRRPGPFLSAIPDETIAPGNNNIIGPSIYGARTYGDFMCDRQTLSFVILCEVIDEVATGLRVSANVSSDYTQALAGYAASVVARKIRRSTRGCTLDISRAGIHDIYANQGSIVYSQDFVEAGIGTGPGTWASLTKSTLATLDGLLRDAKGVPVEVSRGSATSIVLRPGSVAAVVTDPPYDEMLAYADSSDLIYAWLKRVLVGSQEKTEEIIVKRVRGEAPNEHRTREHYDKKIAAAFSEMNRVLRDDGVVTIVFGSGDPEVWQRLLTAIRQADLVMTGSWPANTEAGSHQGKANIETTLTMACRPAPSSRPSGRKGSVESEIKAEIRRRYPDWERWGLAPADMLMAAAGPAMEVVGRYESVLDARGEPVDIDTFLPLSRAAVQDAMAVEVDHHPLETFDARTRFALWWVRLYGRQAQAKSELRWQSLASSMDIADVRDLIPEADKGVAFTTARGFRKQITPDAAVIDVVLALAAASEDGLASMGEVLAASRRSADDAYLWAAVKFLADRLPAPDPDAIALTRVLRTRDGISNAAKTIVTTDVARQRDKQRDDAQLRLL